MTKDHIEELNESLAGKSPAEVIDWAVDYGAGNAIVSTNFRPLEAVLLHMTTRAKPDIPVLWVDTGYNTSATYRFAEQVIEQLDLNVKKYIPLDTAAHRDAKNGGIPDIDDQEKHDRFTHEVKLEPFTRGLSELKPKIWFTALRKEQTAFRETLGFVSEHTDGILKISPVLYFTEADMKTYLAEHNLPDEEHYYDPTKVLEKRECGLHVGHGKQEPHEVNPS
ncbi:MAG: phosphoadenosine phosphosulfate reductase family protein [Verrucomicrobiota bacterium]